MTNQKYVHIRRHIRILVFFFLVVVVTTVGWNIRHGYRSAIDSALHETQSRATMIAEHASRSFGEIDRVLDIIIHELGPVSDSGFSNEKRQYEIFVRNRNQLPQSASFFFVRSDGTLSSSSLEYPLKRIDVSNREFFQHHRDIPDDKPFISRPYLNRTSNKWRFAFSQRISHPDGSFAGLVGASIDMGYFDALYAELFKHATTNISLVRDDGYFIVNHPPDVQKLSENIATGRMFREFLPRWANKSFMDTGTAGEAPDRLVAFSRVPGIYPLIAQITIDREHVIAAWRHNALVQGSLLVVFACATLLLSAGLQRRLHELERSADEIGLLSRIVEQSPVSVVITDRDAAITYVNPRFTELTGYSFAEALGQNPRILKTEATPQQTFDDMWQKLSSGHEWYGELCNKKKDGSVYWEMAYLFPIFGHDGQVTHFAAVKENITDRKLATEELQRAWMAAEAATQAKSEFLANMSHEIRTPLNAITGMAHLALQTGLDERQRDYVSKIVASSKSLLRIINDILDLSKIESGNVDLEATHFSLSELMEGVSSIVGVRAQEKGLELHFELGSDLPVLLTGDPLRLQQILINLISNAVKFTDRGKIDITVKRSGSLATEGRVPMVFTVTDTGIGMTEEQMVRIFTPFGQADSSITRRYGGTGLGLSIVKHLVELMSGTLEVTSRPGTGSRFSFEVTLGSVAAAQVYADEHHHGYAARLRHLALETVAGARVLLVEDDPFNCQIAQEMLSQTGMEVTIANTGRQAVDLLMGTESFDLILMDLQMPEMGGLEATRLIRQKYDTETLPIVAMTACVMNTERDRCLAAGMNDYLTKPVHPVELTAVLLRWIARMQLPEYGTDTVLAHTTDGASSFLTALPGINLSAVQERLAGDQDLLLEIFQAAEPHLLSVLATLQGAVSRQDFDQALFQLHSLRGGSANIGAEKLWHATGQIEQSIQSGELCELPTLMKNLQRCLDEVIDSIRFICNKTERDTDRPSARALNPVEQLELSALFTKMAGYLKSNNASAVKVFRELHTRLPASRSLAALENQVNKLDFKMCESALRKIASENDITFEG